MGAHVVATGPGARPAQSVSGPMTGRGIRKLAWWPVAPMGRSVCATLGSTSPSTGRATHGTETWYGRPAAMSCRSGASRVTTVPPPRAASCHCGAQACRPGRIPQRPIGFSLQARPAVQVLVLLAAYPGGSHEFGEQGQHSVGIDVASERELLDLRPLRGHVHPPAQDLAIASGCDARPRRGM